MEWLYLALIVAVQVGCCIGAYHLGRLHRERDDAADADQSGPLLTVEIHHMDVDEAISILERNRPALIDAVREAVRRNETLPGPREVSH